MSTDFMSLIATDSVRFARSKNLINKASGTYNIIRLPHFAFVREIVLVETVAYAGGAIDGTISIGFTGNGEVADVDGFMTVAHAQAAVVGSRKISDDIAAAWYAGKWFNTAGGQVTITFTTGTCTTLVTGVVFCEYYVIH